MALGFIMLGVSFVCETLDKIQQAGVNRNNARIAKELKSQGKNDLNIYMDSTGQTRDLATGKPCFVRRELNGDRVIEYYNGEKINCDEQKRIKEGKRTARENKLKYPGDKAVFARHIYPKETGTAGKVGDLFIDSEDMNKKYLVRTFEWDPNNICFIKYMKNYLGLPEELCRAQFYMDYDTGMLVSISDLCRKRLNGEIPYTRYKYRVTEEQIKEFISVFNTAQKSIYGFYWYKDKRAEEMKLRIKDYGFHYFFDEQSY